MRLLQVNNLPRNLNSFLTPLPLPLQPLPTLYTCFGFAYTLSLFLWSYTIRKAKASESTSTLSRTIRKDIKVHHVHHVMTFLLVVKVMTVYCDALRWHYIRWTGSGEAWSVFFYFFSFLKGMMLFLVILLIGSGWSFVKPFLSDKGAFQTLVSPHMLQTQRFQHFLTLSPRLSFRKKDRLHSPRFTGVRQHRDPSALRADGGHRIVHNLEPDTSPH